MVEHFVRVGSPQLALSTAVSEPQLSPDLRFDRQTSLSVLKSKTAIKALRPRIAALLNQTGQAQDVTLALEYFLEKNELRCAPALLLIHQQGELAAVVYGRERAVVGIRTGVVQFGDYYGEGAVIAHPHFKATAIAWAALKVLDSPRVHTVRASFKIKDHDDIEIIDSLLQARTKVKSQMLQEGVRHTLLLKNTFDEFLNTLGSHTRRNLRVYRRKVEQKGWTYTQRLGPADVEAAFEALGRQQGTHKSSVHYLNCCRTALKAVPGAFYAGIRTPAGEWVSLTAGWLKNEQFFMLIQLNDARYLRESISTVMRSFLIEDLIGSGVTALNFVGGSSELLRRFCVPQPCAHYLLEKQGPLSKLRGVLTARFFRNSMVSRITRGESGDNAPDTEDTSD